MGLQNQAEVLNHTKEKQRKVQPCDAFLHFPQTSVAWRVWVSHGDLT